MNPNVQLAEMAKVVTAFGPAVPSSASPDWVSLKNYSKLTILIQALNATTVTGSAVALEQATAVAGTSSKALAFDTVRRNIDTAAGDTLTAAAVTSDTFTTDSTNSKGLMYVIEVDAADLDVDGGFDCVRVTLGDATAATISATYVLWPARYGSATPPSAIVD